MVASPKGSEVDLQAYAQDKRYSAISILPTAHGRFRDNRRIADHTP